MKKKDNNNYSGIVVCDSITMSVKKKKHDFRLAESVLIAATGFTTVIMAFLEMFRFRFEESYVLAAAIIFSIIYSVFALIGKRTFTLVGTTFIVFAVAVYRYSDQIIKGFKYVYNVIYSDANHTEIKYYKFLETAHERQCTTILFIFCIWLLALVIYTFTIARPNPIPIFAVTFPIIEIGLYNGIHIPIFWGILTVAFWFAVLAMCSIDMGEYYGGDGGFVRKYNLFFPKRHMRLKVTEKCAIIVIFSVLIVTSFALGIMKATGYKRSDDLNQKRTNIKNAVNSFTMDDLASSISAITEAFGFTFDYESHKLGDMDRLSYRNTTDLSVTFDKKCSGAVYLKNYSGGLYNNNEWFSLSAESYDKADALFSSFKDYKIYPQDFPGTFSQTTDDFSGYITVWIENKHKKNRCYTPYGTSDFGGMSYSLDNTVSSKKSGESSYSYKFAEVSAEAAAAILDEENRMLLDSSRITDSDRRADTEKYCENNDRYDYDTYFSVDTFFDNSAVTPDNIYNSGAAALAIMIEEDYRSFVYENYLRVPDTKELNEVKDIYGDILGVAESADTASARLEVLYALKERINSMTQYSLSPGKTPSNRDFVNYFLLENHKGYCTHYATAGVILARMAGIPARYATGYIVVGDDFNTSSKNSDGSYTIKVADSRSHAWAEVYLDGYGWIPFEFTAGYSDSSINTGTSTSPESTSSPQTETTAVSSVSTDNSTDTHRTRSTRATTDNRTVTSASTTSTSGAHGSKGDASDVDHKGIIPKPAANALIAAVCIVLVIGAILLRRVLILRHRDKLLRKGKTHKRIIEMYEFSEKLLKILGIVKGRLSYMDFAAAAEKILVPEYARSGEFTLFVETALSVGFGNAVPSKEQLNCSYSFVRNLSNKIYEKANPFKKIYLKYIIVII